MATKAKRHHTKRVYKVKYAWKRPGGYETTNVNQVLIAAHNLIEAAVRGQHIAKKECRADGEVFLRLVSVKSQGIVHG